MGRRLLFGALLVCCLTTALEAESRQPRFLTFSAKDRNGIFLRDLKAAEVTLRIGNKPVEVRYFGYRDVDTALAFLIENSPRTAQYNVSMPQFGRINIVDQVRYTLSGGYLQNIVENGAAMIAEFHRELTVLQDFTSDEYLLSAALDKMKPNVASLDKENIPIGRMIGRGVDMLRARPEKRKALVLFTTVVDRDSINHLDEYEEMLRFFDVDLYVVSFARGRNASGFGSTHAEKINSLFFRRLTEETSGKLYLTGEYVFLDEFMDDLRTRLANSYTLGFYVDPVEERTEHEVELTIDRPKCEANYRKKLVF